MFTEEDLTFFISGNTPSSKNGKRIFSGNLVKNDSTQRWLKMTEKEFGNKKVTVSTQIVSITVDGVVHKRKVNKQYAWGGGQRMWFQYVTSFMSYPLQVEFTFIRDKHQKFDYVNPLQSVLDSMVNYDWLVDDHVDIIKPHFGDYQYDKDNPGVIIKILNNPNDL